MSNSGEQSGHASGQIHREKRPRSSEAKFKVDKCMPPVRSGPLATPGVVLKAWRGNGQYLHWGEGLL
eukprot:1160839-Pelagomonas_calceolata.AAC.5